MQGNTRSGEPSNRQCKQVVPRKPPRHELQGVNWIGYEGHTYGQYVGQEPQQGPRRPLEKHNVWVERLPRQPCGIRIPGVASSGLSSIGSASMPLGSSLPLSLLPGPSSRRRRLAEGHASTDTPWMHPGPTRPPPQRARGIPELPVQLPQAPLPPPQPPPLQNETADPAANTGHHTPPWSKAWSVIEASDLDRAARVTAWRLLHGKLFVGAFQRHIHRGTAASHLCTHASCQGRLATLTHVFLSCPCSAPVWQGFANLWAAITQGPAPRFTADLLLPDDPRGGWYPSAELLPLWHRLRLLLISKLSAACSTARLPPTARLPTDCRLRHGRYPSHDQERLAAGGHRYPAAQRCAF
jgi:hypothetical protein